jgi:DNA-directed RNA polymerase specialized sigma24 family protein
MAKDAVQDGCLRAFKSFDRMQGRMRGRGSLR